MGKTALIVEDEIFVALDLERILTDAGYHVCAIAPDSEAALAAARTLAPDLALLDIGMPGMTGYEVARAMRQLPDLERTVLAAVTGWGAQEDRRRSREAGFDFHMTKPIDLDSLNRLLAGIQAAPATLD